MNTASCFSFSLILVACLSVVPAHAKTGTHHKRPHATKMHTKAKMVAYDAKDKRYYSVSWAKAHGMHDKGGDPLTIVPMSTLPKDAKESKAMKGAKI